MPRVYEVEVEGRGVVPDFNHLTTALSLAEHSSCLCTARLPSDMAKFLGVKTYGELHYWVTRGYLLTATDPWALTKG